MLGWPRPVWISRAIHLSVPVPVPGGIPTKLRTPQFRRWLGTGSRSAFVHRELVPCVKADSAWVTWRLNRGRLILMFLFGWRWPGIRGRSEEYSSPDHNARGLYFRMKYIGIFIINS